MDEGKIGGALSFDGVDDFVVVNSSPELSLRNNFTLSAWLKINVKVNDSSDQIIIRKGNVDYDFKIYGQNRDLYNRGILEFGGNTGSLYVRWIKSSQSFTNNTWTHVIGIYLKEKLVLNINGQKMKEQTTSGKFGFCFIKIIPWREDGWIKFIRTHRRCSHLRPCLIRRRSAGSVQLGAVSFLKTPYPTTLKTALFNSSLRLPHLWTIWVSI